MPSASRVPWRWREDAGEPRHQVILALAIVRPPQLRPSDERRRVCRAVLLIGFQIDDGRWGSRDPGPVRYPAAASKNASRASNPLGHGSIARWGLRPPKRHGLRELRRWLPTASATSLRCAERGAIPLRTHAAAAGNGAGARRTGLAAGPTFRTDGRNRPRVPFPGPVLHPGATKKTDASGAPATGALPCLLKSVRSGLAGAG